MFPPSRTTVRFVGQANQRILVKKWTPLAVLLPQGFSLINLFLFFESIFSIIISQSQSLNSKINHYSIETTTFNLLTKPILLSSIVLFNSTYSTYLSRPTYTSLTHYPQYPDRTQIPINLHPSGARLLRSAAPREPTQAPKPVRKPDLL